MNRTKLNQAANKKLVKMYVEKGITTCELRLEGCNNNWGLGFAHRMKRRFYISWPEGLSEFNQTVLACTPCHEKIEFDPELSEEMFEKLRGPEDD